MDENSEADSKIHIELNENIPKEEDPFDDIKSKHKELFVTYCDDNVKLMDGEEMTETADIDMRKSLHPYKMPRKKIISCISSTFQLLSPK